MLSFVFEQGSLSIKLPKSGPVIRRLEIKALIMVLLTVLRAGILIIIVLNGK